MDPSTPIQNPLIRKLESIFVLSDDERSALLGLAATITNVGADEEIIHEGNRPSECCLIVEGFACRYTMTEEGKRQIFSFHIPGDIPDLQSLHLEVMDHSLGTLVPSRLAFIPHAAIRDLMRRCPRIADAFWRDTLIDAAVFRAEMVGLGRRDAYGRIAHLLCELFVRLKAVGLTSGRAYALPITQAELGDALGLSTVHVNRTLQQLRGDGLIQTQGGTVMVQDWERLKRAGQFEETYLHLRKEAA